ncbi:cytochrome P450 family protein [Periconia macrospinosa]|uniref:Cytochrome P450 family protein n=1 Tax=Periconia macrospinosa TaxID=97972 RepID=A0A2V1D5I8_9PLEO|nr:cytochrome P450 family protein [Periconia macrospinosa]
MALIEFLSVPSVTLVAISIFVLVRHILYPAFFSPLAKIPNAHPLAAITPAWITWIRFTNVENKTVYEAHKRHGPVVRLGPSELSVNCVDHGIKTIYGKGFEKTNFYSFFANYGILNMFSSLQSHPHSTKKKRISNVYSKSHLLGSADVQAIVSQIIHERILPLIANKAATNTPIDVFILYQAAALDLTSAYFFGLPVGTNFIQNDDARNKWLQQYHKSHPFDAIFWLQHIPGLTLFLAKLGIHVLPKDRIWFNDEFDAWCLNLCARAENLLAEVDSGTDERQPGNFPVVYEQLKRITKKEKMSEEPSIHLKESAARQKGREVGDLLDVPRSPQQLEIASELLDQLVATHGTLPITLLYVSWELSRNPEMQRRLRAELKSLPIPLEYGSAEKSIPDARTLDDLPLLHAVIMETLRLHPAIPGGQPRVTPQGSVTQVGDYAGIPPGTLVNSYAWSLHRNPDVFPDPEGWHPERWLESEESATYQGSDKKERWFWAFSSGSRMCVGSNFAMQVMKFTLAALYTNFFSTIVDDEGIEQMDGYIAGPKGDKLVLAFKPAPQETE